MVKWKTFPGGRGEKVSYQIKQCLCKKRTKFQLIEILDTFPYGVALFLDSMGQSSEKDEFIYHEGLVHPAMVIHPRPRKVLIAGGGEGATLREALRHKTVKEVVMIDIDKEAVDLCKKYLKKWHKGAFEDARVKLFHQDARDFLRKTKKTFDCIFIDITDPLPGSPSYLLYTKEFYSLVKSRLSSDGVMVTQAETTNINNLNCFLAIVKTLSEVFPVVRPYQMNIPFYAAGWGFAIASKRFDPLWLLPQKIDQILKKRRCQPLGFYDGTTHQMIFSLPRYLRMKLKKTNRIITDKKPIFFLG